MIPYAKHEITPEDETAVLAALRSEHIAQGPLVQEFERALCDFTGAAHAVCVSSGTAALYCAYAAVGVKGKTVGVPARTFVATAAMLDALGATPFPIDIATGRDGMPMVAVDYGGRPGREISHNTIVTDAAHSLRWDTESHATTLSFHPAKHITTGEGGAVLTGSSEMAAHCRQTRDHGRIEGRTAGLGFNFRMSEIAAALGLSQLPKAEGWRQRRHDLALRYNAALGRQPGDGYCNGSPCNGWHHIYVIEILEGSRDRVLAYLRGAGIGAAVHYVPWHLQPYFREKYDYGRGDAPWAETFADQAITLPLFPSMTDEQVDYVIAKVKEAIG